GYPSFVPVKDGPLRKEEPVGAQSGGAPPLRYTAGAGAFQGELRSGRARPALARRKKGQYSGITPPSSLLSSRPRVSGEMPDKIGARVPSARTNWQRALW